MSLFIRLSALFLAFSLLSACTVYRLDIQQGNFVDQRMLDQLKVGMTHEQVRFIMGIPMIKDPFHPHRWDYKYYLDSRYEKRDSSHRVTVFFEGDRVSRIVTKGVEDIEKSVFAPPVKDEPEDSIETEEEMENAEDLKNLPGTDKEPLDDKPVDTAN